jgi:16S rRNA (adenine1518-N6/adenine1519-N6)-dimethyltransferase
VWSAVVRLTMRAAPLFRVSPHYAAVVAAAFAQRRKTLRNALSRMLTREQISACALDPGARPETLAPEQFNTLALALDRGPDGR